jgi:hypothetical protein
MATWYICPKCTRSINRLFALPPVRPVTTCRTCGEPVHRSIGSIAQAWVFFVPLLTLSIATLVFLAFDMADAKNSMGFLYCFGKAVFVAALGIPVGALVGAAVGVLSGAPWQDRCMSPWEACVAERLYEESQPDPKFAFTPPRPLTNAASKEKCCWHCGNVFTVAANVPVRCPRCQAGLGGAISQVDSPAVS